MSNTPNQDVSNPQESPLALRPTKPRTRLNLAPIVTEPKEPKNLPGNLKDGLKEFRKPMIGLPDRKVKNSLLKELRLADTNGFEKKEFRPADTTPQPEKKETTDSLQLITPSSNNNLEINKALPTSMNLNDKTVTNQVSLTHFEMNSFVPPENQKLVNLAQLEDSKKPDPQDLTKKPENKKPVFPPLEIPPSPPLKIRKIKDSNRSNIKKLSYERKFAVPQAKKDKDNLENPSIEEDDPLDDFDSELENILIKFPPLIINPYGGFRRIWDLFMIGLLMYFCYILPVRLCFRRNPSMFEEDRTTDFDDEWLAFDIICDLILVTDIILNFFSAYENDAGLIIFSKPKIMKRYVTHWFFIDLISTFPINRNIFNLPHIRLEDINFSRQNYIIWRMVRFIKLVRIFKLNNSIERLFSLMTLNVDKINIIKFASFISVFMHITACLWNATAELQGEMGWQRLEDLQDKTLFDRYISSIYFGLTVLLTIGFGNIHPSTLTERVIATIWMFFGIIVYTYIISALTSSFAKLNQTQSVQEEKDLFFREWNKMFKLPYETLDMILNTIGLKNQSQSTHKMQALNLASGTLAMLPKALHSEIYNFFFEDVLNKVMFFRNKPTQFLLKLLPLLKPTNFARGDYIYKERDPAMEVFFVVKGRVISKCRDRQHKDRAQIFVEGSFFGEMDIFLKRNRVVSTRAENECELWKIDKEDFLSVLDQFPTIKDEVEQLVKIKESYRKPISMLQKKSAAQRPSSAFKEPEVPEENGIFSALTTKMIKKIRKGKYHMSSDNKHTYESLDFEPDLPSPESVDSTKSILSEAEWKNFEQDMTQRLVRKRTGLRKRTRTDESNLLSAGTLQKQFKYRNTGIKQRMLKRKADRETLRKSILSRRGSPFVVRKISIWAKNKLMEDLKDKNIEISHIDEIDEVLHGKDELIKVRDETIQKTEKTETDFDKMIADAEKMLFALHQFEEGLEEMVDLQNTRTYITNQKGIIGSCI